MLETNGDEFAAEMKREVQKLEAETQSMIEDLTDTTYEESQRLVPVDTGDLKASADQEVTGLGVDVEGSVWYSAPYAAFVGLGTRYQSAQPYLHALGPRLIKKALADLSD